MALELENFKELGGAGNSIFGGQVYSVFSETDSIDDMTVLGYLDQIIDTLNVRDIVLFSSTTGPRIVQIKSVSGGVVAVTQSLRVIFGQETISGSGTANPDPLITFLAMQTGADAVSLPDGILGQEKIFIAVSESDSADIVTITPATPLGFNTIIFNALGAPVSVVN